MPGQVLKLEKIHSLASNFTEDSSGLKPEDVPSVDDNCIGKNAHRGIALALPKLPPGAKAALRLCWFVGVFLLLFMFNGRDYFFIFHLAR